MSQGGHSEPLLLLALFYQSTPSCLKVIGGWVGGWWPIRLYCHPQSQLGLGFGLDWGLTIIQQLLFIRVHDFRNSIRSLSKGYQKFGHDGLGRALDSEGQGFSSAQTPDGGGWGPIYS